MLTFRHGRKVAEICCTSIVYATEKKQTKVEFPEARIYEEALNILLYEGWSKILFFACFLSTEILSGPKNFAIPGADMEKDVSGELVPRVRRIHAGGHSHQPSNSNLQNSTRWEKFSWKFFPKIVSNIQTLLFSNFSFPFCSGCFRFKNCFNQCFFLFFLTSAILKYFTISLVKNISQLVLSARFPLSCLFNVIRTFEYYLLNF